MDHLPPQRDRIEPSATATATGHCAEFFADPLQRLTGLIEEFRLERPGADPRRIGLDYAEHIIKVARPDPGAGAGVDGDGMWGVSWLQRVPP